MTIQKTVADLPEHPEGYVPVTEGMTANQHRSLRGAHAVRAYAMITNELKDDPATAIQDLLADLMHLCDALPADFEELVANARMHYREERLEQATEEGQPDPLASKQVDPEEVKRVRTLVAGDTGHYVREAELYTETYPPDPKWVKEHDGQVVCFEYTMTLPELIEVTGIEGMNEALDNLLGADAKLLGISYEQGPALDDGINELLDGRSVVVWATGTLEAL